MATDNRTLLEMLQGGAGQGQQQQQQQQQISPAQAPAQGQFPHGLPHQHSSPIGEMSMPPPPPMSHPFFPGMGSTPPPSMGMMPGLGFNPQQQSQQPHLLQPRMDQQQQMLLQLMQGGSGQQQRGPPMGPYPSGLPPPQSRPPPQGNALASLLQSLNQPVSSTASPIISSTGGTFGGASSQPPLPTPPLPTQGSQHQSLPRTPPAQADLQASTESLKLALFGGPKPEPTAQQKTEDLKMALFGGPRPDLAHPQPSTKKEEVNLLAILQKSSNTSSPTPIYPEPTTDSPMEPKAMELKKESSHKASSSSKDSTPQSTSKAKFTYVNPFNSFTSSAAAINANANMSSTMAAATATTSQTVVPSVAATPGSPPVQSRTTTPVSGPQDTLQSGAGSTVSKRPSSANPVPRREAPTHAESEGAGRSTHERDQKRYQVDQFLPPHSAWNHRVQKLAKGSSSVPDGVYLTHPKTAANIYDIGLDNLDAIFSEDLETIPITLIPTDVEYNTGKMVAVSKGYISYAAKGGKIRVLQQAHGHRTLLRGHTDQVIDMGFSSPITNDPSVSQLLVSVGKDSKVIIWNLSGSDIDSTDIAHSQYMELVGVAQADQPRYSRAVWSPSQPSTLALVNNDDNSVLIVDIQSLMSSQASTVLDEAQFLEHAITISAHDQTINDISFSPDGSVIVTASEDGTVKYWAINATSATFLHEFVPHGGLGVTNAMLIDEIEKTAARCLVTACRRGTELGLWDVTGSALLDLFIFKEPPSSARRSSLGKAVSRLQDMRMFNFMGFDFETSSLVLANSARLSLFGLKISVSSSSGTARSGGGPPPLGSSSQAQYIKSRLLASDGASCGAKFEFMIEYPMPQQVISFVVIPDSSPEYNGFSVYCIQTKAVQQYIIKGLEPHDKHKCHTFTTSPPASKATEPKGKQGSKQVTASVSSTSTLISAGGVGVGGPKLAGSSATKGPEAGETTPAMEEQAIEQTVGTQSSVAEIVATEKEPEKALKLHGPVINGAIAKLKEKKRNAAAAAAAAAATVPGSVTVLGTEGHGGAVEGSDKKESPKMTTSARMGRKGSQDMSVQEASSASAKKDKTGSSESSKRGGGGASSGRQQAARQQEQTSASSSAQSSTTGSTTGLQTQTSSALFSNDQATVSISDLQSMMQSMEEGISARIEKRLSAELEQQYHKVEENQLMRQEAILKMVSQALSTNTEQVLVQTVNKEMQQSVIPALNKIVGSAVERQLSRTLSDIVAKTLPTSIESAVNEQVERVLGSSAFMSKLTNQVATTIKPSIEESFKDSFSKVLIPSYQKATHAMFQQMHSAFLGGIEELTKISGRDMESTGELVMGLKRVVTTVDAIQGQLAQVPRMQLHGQSHPPMDMGVTGMQHPFGTNPVQDHRRSVTNGLQRALQGDEPVNYGTVAGAGSQGSRRTSQPMGSPSESRQHQQQSALNQLIAYGDYEKAFTQALSTNDGNVVFQLCSKVSPRAVFQATEANPSGTLSQPVLLALTHHLASEEASSQTDASAGGAGAVNSSQNNLGIKLTWLQEIFLRLNPRDPLLVDHMSRILPMVQARLEGAFEEVTRNGEPTPHTNALQLLLRYISSMRQQLQQPPQPLQQ
ncbi:hypothetical protein BGW38_005964 [Lunasporangiospora selenospora]|uniref:Enhancer of mRNA-decapping protein 4 WD40 repeat region domain-containing protein n=1 Tax=Lunasporangiospora selenospora TaxID=979761 RepID=A0A9P6G2U9_9FUNG|nr:hypothetical protein BGW38_005964 [Lunasporangiospora selenospora]